MAYYCNRRFKKRKRRYALRQHTFYQKRNAYLALFFIYFKTKETKAVYNFTIDTTFPELTIDGANNKEAVNKDVAVFFTEQNLITELFKNVESIGVYNSGDVLFLTVNIRSLYQTL